MSRILVAVATAIALTTAVVSGGRISALVSVSIRHERLLLFGITASALIPLAAGVLGSAALPIWIMSIALIAVAAGANHAFRGLLLVSLGASLNLLTVLANAGMPASGAALLAASGRDSLANLVLEPMQLRHLSSVGTRLLCTSDAIPLPGLPQFASVVSVGDLCVAVGVAGFILEVAFSPPGGSDS